MDPSIRLIHRIEPRSPLMVAAWPGMGNVAYGAAVFLKESLKAVRFAEILPEGVFHRTGVQIRDGVIDIPDLPRSEFFFFENYRDDRDLILFLGESQPAMEKEYELARRVVEVAGAHGVQEIITFAATPVNISHKTEPGVWGVATDRNLLQKLPAHGVKIMNAGHIGGLNGLVLGASKEQGIGGVCLLGEIPFYTVKIENPKSSLAIVRVFMQYTGITVSVDSLEQMARFVEEEIERVSKSSRGPGIGGAETKAAGGEKPEQETGIPDEARQRIEYLFKTVAEDLSRVGELKEELDRWGLFQEYEDRFLDLFGRDNR